MKLCGKPKKVAALFAKALLGAKLLMLTIIMQQAGLGDYFVEGVTP
jgi:hypothetical protein